MVTHVKVRISSYSEKDQKQIIWFSDINECTDLTICGNGNCLNTIGSYMCICPTGYQFDNETCVGKFFLLHQ